MSKIVVDTVELTVSGLPDEMERLQVELASKDSYIEALLERIRMLESGDEDADSEVR